MGLENRRREGYRTARCGDKTEHEHWARRTDHRHRHRTWYRNQDLIGHQRGYLMIPSSRLQFTLSNLDLPAKAVWQDAIDGWNLLLPVVIVEVRPAPDAVSRVEIAGRLVEFSCERRLVSDVVGERQRHLACSWSFAYAFGSSGEMLSSVAAGVAALSYASVTDGTFYLPDVGPLHNPAMFREALDEILAVHCDGMSLYRSRYPGKFKVASDRHSR